MQDLNLINGWLGAPDVGRWYLVGSTIAEEIEELRRCILGIEPTWALLVVEQGRSIRWCQWYLCSHYPEHAREAGAEPGDAGIDYAIGTRRAVARASAQS